MDEIEKLKRLTLLLCDVARVSAVINSMIAANQVRIQRGESLAYPEGEFTEREDELGILYEKIRAL